MARGLGAQSSETDTETQTETETETTFPSPTRLPILAVDDRMENLVALEAVLAPLGLSVVTARSGEEALRLLLERDFALILLDVRMPGLDGIETARLIKLRERTRDVPIVFLTAAHDEIGEIVRGYDVGAVDYVLKPFDPELLRSKVAVFTELEQSRRALRQSEAFLRSAFEAGPIGKTVVDVRRHIVRANPPFARLVGRDQDELAGVPVLDLCHPDDRPGLAALLDHTFAAEPGPGDEPEIDVRLMISETRELWVSPTASPIAETEQALPRLLVQWVDVTARRRAEQARAELLIAQAGRAQAEANAARLERLQKLAEPVEARAFDALLAELVTRLIDVLEAVAAEVVIDEGEHRAAHRLGDEPAGTSPSAAEDWHEVRLATADGTHGVLRVGFAPGRGPTGADLAMLRDAADRVSLVIRRAQLHEQEHRIAVELQRGLLPKRLPDVPGIEIAARTEAAGLETEVGGDWYDAFPLPDDRLGVVIGDVTGSGIRAASMMGQLRSVTRAFALADPAPSPAEVLTRVHLYHAKLGFEQLFTVLYVILDPGEGSVVWANAGHPPPVLRSATGDARLLYGSETMMTFTEVTYRDRHATALPGDALLLYTDGLVERRGEAIDVGLRRLVAAVQASPSDPPGMCAHVMSTTTGQTDRSEDDVTAVVLRVAERYPGRRAHDAPVTAPRLEVVLASDLGAGTTARRLLEQAFGRLLERSELDRAKLAVSELAINAVRHGRGDVTLRADLDESRLRVEVIDEGSGFAPASRETEPRSVGGWGLDLVEGASTRWGIREDAPHVWFEIERAGTGKDLGQGGVVQR